MKTVLIITLCFFTLILSVKGQSKSDSIGIPLDTVLKNKLEIIRTKDQTLRLMLPQVVEKFGQDSRELKYFWYLIHVQDTINEKEVTNIIDKYGWLGANRVGNNANQCIWLVIQHAPLNIQEKYLPLLEESVIKGESEGWYLAYLTDRILMYNGKNQKYGSQTKFNKSIGKNYIYPIDDPKNVNTRRKEVGLEPIEEYAIKNGFIYNPLEWK